MKTQGCKLLELGIGVANASSVAAAAAQRPFPFRSAPARDRAKRPRQDCRPHGENAARASSNRLSLNMPSRDRAGGCQPNVSGPDALESVEALDRLGVIAPGIL